MTDDLNTTQERHSTREATAGAAAAGLAAIAAIAALWWWLSAAPSFDLDLRVPLESNITLRASGITAPLDLSGTFISFGGVPAALQGFWPRFRGTGFDNIAAPDERLADTWPRGGPEVLWSIPLGDGHAGPAVLGGRFFVMDYDEDLGGDALRCFSLADGTEIWRRWYGVKIKRNHGISRTVPAVTEKFVVAMGPKCHVTCLDSQTGEFLWGIDLQKDYETQVPLWYTGQCPLIDGDTAVVAPGGSALLVGIDCATGDVKWRTPNPDGWAMSHSSVMPMEFGGRRMYVYCAIGGVVGVAADGPDAGEVLWRTDAWDRPVISPSPIIFEDGRIFLTAGYGGGSMMIRVSEDGGAFRAETVYTLDKTVFSSEQQTPILYEGYLYGVLTNDAGAARREFACLDPAGEVVWTSGRENRFGLGPFLVADGKILVLSDDGVLTMIEATPAGYRQMVQAEVLDGRDAWGPMALVDGRLLLRDSRTLKCLDVGARARGAPDG